MADQSRHTVQVSHDIKRPQVFIFAARTRVPRAKICCLETSGQHRKLRRAYNYAQYLIDWMT
jgi:hypothetical protein